MLQVVETFKSAQGEGVLMGVPMYFIRLKGCNFRCPFCDTKYSWAEGREMTEEELVKEAIEAKTNFVCLTGGEPLMQNVYKLVQLLKDAQKLVMVETNGSLYEAGIAKIFDYVSISPKFQYRPKDLSLPDYLLNVRFFILNAKHFQCKFVIEHNIDAINAYANIKHLTHGTKISGPFVFQPNGMLTDELYFGALQELWNIVQNPMWMNYDVRVIPQLHRILFGQKRGV
jgi:7-carboxy-7-deazaguanine synthase